MTKPSIIDLTADEQELLDEIVFKPAFDENFSEVTQRSCRAGAELTRTLLSRNAIPYIRLRYFTDPDLNSGKSKRSRQQMFEANGRTGDAILEHPHFLPYLKYFLFGPDLPPDVIEQFAAAIDSGDDIADLRQMARDETRHHRLDPKHASEEYFKLALECGVSELSAQLVKDAVRRIKT